MGFADSGFGKFLAGGGGSLIGAGVSLIGGLIGAGKARRAARRQRREADRLNRRIESLEANRQAVINPYANVKDLSSMVTNPFEFRPGAISLPRDAPAGIRTELQRRRSGTFTGPGRGPTHRSRQSNTCGPYRPQVKFTWIFVQLFNGRKR